MMSWKTFVARSALAATMMGVAVFAGVRLASAGPGAPGGPTTDSMTFAGVLRERAGMSTQLTFVFRKTGAGGVATEVCRSTTGMFTPAASGGAFSVLVSIDPSTTNCPRGLFDGADVWYDIVLGGADAGATLTDSPVPITPVPYARFADQSGVNNDCPAGYTRDTIDTSFSNDMRLCKRTVSLGTRTVTDEVVRVGTGASAYWVDRFEASVFDRTGTATTFPYAPLQVNGSWGTGSSSPPLLAMSVSGQNPSVNINWFQANATCRASGKHLMTIEEWLSAGVGTPDNASSCNTSGAAVHRTGVGGSCASAWGVQDMIGNLQEIGAEWNIGIGSGDSHTAWPSLPGDPFAGDQLVNVDSSGYIPVADAGRGIGPVMSVRGGYWRGGAAEAGLYYMYLANHPSYSNVSIGFRCAISR